LACWLLASQLRLLRQGLSKTQSLLLPILPLLLLLLLLLQSTPVPQVLQTLSIIIQNVRSETGIFFLFSNNHINNIVDLEFDFNDEEVLGYYVSFLKTISLKLNTGTVHFFLNSSSTGKGFPLYTRAIRLAHNREGMVRAAVRTLTLNVCSVPDPDIISFVTSPPAAQYFTEVAQYMADQVQVRGLQAGGAGSSSVIIDGMGC
jgi:protein CLEC16A